jgi:hypothetical protein
MVAVSRYAKLVSSFREAVVATPGKLPEATRRAVFAGGDAGDASTTAFLAKVRTRAYQVTDEDVLALRAAGWDDEGIYELTIAAATGEGMRRLDIGMAALRAAQAKARG